MSDGATSDRARALANGERYRERRRICGKCECYVLRRCTQREGCCFGTWLMDAESTCPKGKW